jgi:tricorn protease
MSALKKFLFFVIIFTTTQNYAQVNPLVGMPALSPDGQTIAFEYQGDIWTVSADGENPKRLTIHEATDSNPHWSADGKTIAFNSNRFGNIDIFTIPVNGGMPKRITYHATFDIITDFTPDGTILFATNRNYAQVEREQEIHSVSANGGTPLRFMDALGYDATLSPNGKFVAFTKGYCRVDREAYRGEANRDIWLYDITNDTYHQLTDFDGQDLLPQWGDNNTIYFQSARSGRYNIHKLTIDDTGKKVGNIEAKTFLRDMGLFSFNVGNGRKTAVLIAGDELKIVDLETNNINQVNLTIHSDYRFDPKERKTLSSGVTDLAVSPNGDYRAFVVRGEVFIAENDKEKSKSVNVSNSPYRDMDLVWLSDEVLLFTSDRDGVYNLYTVTSDDADNKNLFKTLKHKITQITNSKSDISNPALSPDGKSIAFNRGNGELVVASISEDGKISNQKTLVEGWDRPSNVAWSPDSKWLSYNKSDLNFNEDVYVHKADGSLEPVNISMHPKGDYGAVWSKDGSKIGFSSNRNNGDYDVWFVWLKKEDWEKTKQDWDETEDDKPNKVKKKDDKEDEDDKDDKKKDDVKTIVIDFENIHERQEQVTAYTGGEFLVDISKDGKTFYYTTGSRSRGNADVESDLFSIAWDGKDKKELTKGNKGPRNAQLGPKDSYIYYVSRGKTSRVKAKDGKSEALPFQAKMIVDYQTESNQIFEEAWKTINERFYDPNHHGQDWEALKMKYKPLAMKASTRDDFKYIFNKMLGQINASHMGIYRGEERANLQDDDSGYLGVEFSDNKGQLQVSYITPNSAADREASKLQVGDIVVAVNGNEVSVKNNIYQYLIETGNEKIILDITRNGNKQEVVIRPKTSNRTDKYNAWVNERKRLTEKYSDGQLGYIHIQGMNWTSFERFERELMAAGHGKEGVVIDVRFNGGGWTTDYLMAVLNVKQHAYTIPRGAAKDLSKEHTKFTNYYPFSERLPLAAWTKPSIALCNHFSYSNAEIFSHAYKELELGKLVGVPTFGAVISTGGQTLIDGSYVRVPFRGWFVKSSQQNMDFQGAQPDIIVESIPGEKAKGEDIQLKKAVEALLSDL